MNIFLYIVAIILIIGWLIGAFVYHLNGSVHLLLVLALMTTLFNIISPNKRDRGW